MGLTGYADTLRRRWRIVAAAILVAVGVALVVTQLQQRRYESSVRLLVSGSSPSSSETASPELAHDRATLFAQLATTDPVVTAAEETAAGNGSAGVEQAHVAVDASANGAFLTITVSASDPDNALAVAKAYPLVLPGQLAKLNQLPPVTDALLTIVTPPERATHPSAPRPLRNLLLGLGAGLLVGLAVAWLREAFGGGLRDAAQIAPLAHGQLLGIVPHEFEADRLAVASRPSSRRTAAYREVLAALGTESPRSFVVTSPERGAGTSTVTANLAMLLGRSGNRVAVVDADLRHPTLAPIFNLATESGLSDVLTGTAVLADLLQEIPGASVTVLAGGGEAADPDELAAWPAMAEVLRSLAADFEVVVVDGPPARDGSAALQLGALTDGLVVVARPGRTTRTGLRRVLAAIGRSPATLLGVVINGADAPLPLPPPEPRPIQRSRLPRTGSTDLPLEHPAPTYAPPPGTHRRRRERGS